MWLCILQQKMMHGEVNVPGNVRKVFFGWVTVQHVGTISLIVVQNFLWNGLFMVRPLEL